MISPFINSDHPVLIMLEGLIYQEPFKTSKNILGGSVGFFLAERLERRKVSTKVSELRKHYALSWSVRREKSLQTLMKTLEFCNEKVPYYKDLFSKNKINLHKISKDLKYFSEIPLLTKEIIREQGRRLLSCNLQDVRHYQCKTGGSTGQSCFIYYDQISADYASAIVRYGRESIGRSFYRSELHFACRFPEHGPRPWPIKEDFKCFAMNRSNIFFDRIDDTGLEEIWQILKKRQPYLIHGHPSTIYALANYVEKKYETDNAFSVFESSGELLESYMQKKIEEVLQCRIVNRYGLAELGVVAYEIRGHENGLKILDSECWLESCDESNEIEEIFMTSYRNHLMPLIRYASGDLGRVVETDEGRYLEDLTGRIHDIVEINGVRHATHYIQDILDHRVGSVLEFQIDVRKEKPILRIVPEPCANIEELLSKLENTWGHGVEIEFIRQADLIRVGDRAKFRHVVTK